MKKFVFLMIFLACYLGINAQNSQKGTYEIRNGVTVYVAAGSESTPFIPGVPNRTPQDPALVPLATTFINFDDIAAPCLFMDTSPLTSQYTAQGVTFSGTGFSLLNECGGFTLSGYSSPNFVAWNECCSGMVETLTFSTVVSNVAFKAGSAGGGTLIAEAFNGSGQSLGTANAALVSVMQEINLPFTGIAEVEINVSGEPGALDDLMFDKSDAPLETPISNWALFLGLGLILAFTAFRFRRMI